MILIRRGLEAGEPMDAGHRNTHGHKENRNSTYHSRFTPLIEDVKYKILGSLLILKNQVETYDYDNNNMLYEIT